MSSLHKFKAYFGMVPLEEYEDDYLDDPASARRERDRDYDEPPYAGGGYGPSHRDEYKASRREDAGRDFEPDGFDRYEPPVRAARVEPITARAPRPTPAAGPRRRAVVARFRGPPGTVRGPSRRAVRRGRPVVEDHHAASPGLRRGPHDR